MGNFRNIRQKYFKYIKYSKGDGIKLSIIELEDVSFHSDGKTILENISFNVEKGDFISIIGSSGSGKSTLLKLISHLISPTYGNIRINGKDIYEYNPIELRKNISYCFQTPYLFGDKVRENIEFPYFIRNLKIDNERVNELFLRFQMDVDILNQEIKNLSGGEKQRIALIRSLLLRPEVLLLDEITSALDVYNTKIVEGIIESLNKEGITILWVTHDLEQSRRYANKLLTLETGKIKSLEVLR